MAENYFLPPFSLPSFVSLSLFSIFDTFMSNLSRFLVIYTSCFLDPSFVTVVTNPLSLLSFSPLFLSLSLSDGERGKTFVLWENSCISQNQQSAVILVTTFPLSCLPLVSSLGGIRSFSLSFSLSLPFLSRALSSTPKGEREREKGRRKEFL